MPSSPLTIQLFGPLRIQIYGEAFPRVRTRSIEWLLALLVLRHDRTVDRSWLAGTLWPDSEERQALQNLRNDLVSLRKALGRESERLQSPSRDTLTLDLTDAEVDLVRFDNAMKAGDENSLRRAVEVYTGPLLEGCQEEWVLLERESRAQSCLAALETLASQAEQRSYYADALVLLRRAEGMDNLRDSIQRRLMRVLAASGDTPAALMAYREYRLRLRREMNIEPDEEITRLFQELRARSRQSARIKDEGRRQKDESQPLSSPSLLYPPSARPPHPLTPLIGREAEVEALRERLTQNRLVTLIGAGGVGKTRLAMEVAALLEEDLDGRAVWVELAPLAEDALLLPIIAEALDIRLEGESDTKSLESRLISHLSEGVNLLALDNCEHLLDAAAAVVQRLLSRCPGLRVLATSRQRLGLAGEVAWRVPSLPAPDQEPLSADPAEATAIALTYPAIRLFVERASAVREGFRLTSMEDVEAVCQICRRLDGIPLALELAAARVNILPIGQIASRLDDRFRLLTGGNRAVLPRQQTLRALIDWSYQALSAEEKALLRRLAVFSGGWTLEAAEAVHTIGQPAGDSATSAIETLDLLASLAEKSLIHLEPGGAEARYSMLETVQHYALARLREAGEEEQVRDAHLLHFMVLAEEADRSTDRPGQERQVARLDRDIFNIRAALAWVTGRAERGEEYLRLASALRLHWSFRGQHREGIDHLRAALDRTQGSRTAIRARALIAAASLCEALARLEEARQFTDEAGPLLEELGDVWGQAERLRILCLVAQWERDSATAAQLAEESQSLFMRVGDDRMVALTLLHRGRAIRGLGQRPMARTLIEQSLELSRRVGNEMGVAEALHSLAQSARHDGEIERACALLRESLELQRKLDRRFAIAFALEELAAMDLALGGRELARARLEEAAHIWRDSGMLKYQVSCLQRLASIAREMADEAAAERYLQEAQLLGEE